MSGFFPCMMFGIPGAALAMVKCAKPAKKKAAIGILASAAICAFICGVTEPFEFAFMFLAPVLYVIYALLYGIFTMITVALGFRAGFSFSAGAMDLLFSSSLPAAAKTFLLESQLLSYSTLYSISLSRNGILRPLVERTMMLRQRRRQCFLTMTTQQ